MYTVSVDMIHAICDSPSLYVCPWLGGSWRSTLCKVGKIDTVQESEGWTPLNEYRVFVPSPEISIVNKSADVFDPPTRDINLSWEIKNTGVGKVAFSMEPICGGWDCSLIGYAGNSSVYLSEGDSYMAYMKLTMRRIHFIQSMSGL